MGLLELFLIAVGLSMDAFAVSVCKGLSVRTLKAKHAVICGLYFGGFQLLMPLIGFALGVRFQSLITSIDHWIAFVLLGLIGANMVRESREHDDESVSDSFRFMTMLPLAVATSIDALAVGVDVCVPAGRYRSGGVVHRCNHVCAVVHRREDRPCVRHKVQVPRRAVRRYRADFDGSQNPAGAFGFSGITKGTSMRCLFTVSMRFRSKIIRLQPARPPYPARSCRSAPC